MFSFPIDRNLIKGTDGLFLLENKGVLLSKMLVCMQNGRFDCLTYQTEGVPRRGNSPEN